MNIDWSKAPEGATHYFAGATSGCWRDLSGETWKYWRNGLWLDTGLSSSHLLDYPGGMTAVQRPPLEWNGEGLPPVGTVCEYYWVADVSWRSGICVAHYDGRAVICDRDDEDCAERLDARHLRPLRTPEQIAAEEREKAIEEMWSVYWKPEAPTAKQALGLLYDAGYRKQEQTK